MVTTIAATPSPFPVVKDDTECVSISGGQTPGEGCNPYDPKKVSVRFLGSERRQQYCYLDDRYDRD